MSFVLLVMGLPGSGKTTLADAIAERLRASCLCVERINADEMRRLHSDWDFSRDGRIRQAQRLLAAADATCADIVIMDFVAALPEQRAIVAPTGADLVFTTHSPDNLDRVARLAQSRLRLIHA